MAKKKREGEAVVGAQAPGGPTAEQMAALSAAMLANVEAQAQARDYTDGGEDNGLDASAAPDVRGAEISREEHAVDPVDRMRAARMARKTNGQDKPRNPPQYLVLGQRREDGEYDVLAVRKSRRGAVKFATETRGLIRRSYLGVTVMRSKIVHMEGF